jgi:hypothetical protein
MFNELMTQDTRDQFPKPFLHAYVKMRSDRAFERETEMWTLEKPINGHFRIQHWQKDPESRGRIPIMNNIEEFPLDVPIEVAADLLLDRIREFRLRNSPPR